MAVIYREAGFFQQTETSDYQEWLRMDAEKNSFDCPEGTVLKNISGWEDGVISYVNVRADPKFWVTRADGRGHIIWSLYPNGQIGGILSPGLASSKVWRIATQAEREYILLRMKDRPMAKSDDNHIYETLILPQIASL